MERGKDCQSSVRMQKTRKIGSHSRDGVKQPYPRMGRGVPRPITAGNLTLQTTVGRGAVARVDWSLSKVTDPILGRDPPSV